MHVDRRNMHRPPSEGCGIYTMMFLMIILVHQYINNFSYIFSS